MTCTQTSTLGVYLLGALEPEERSAFEGHLSRCEVCRGELVRLAPLPGLLNQITLADVEDVAEPAAAERHESPVAVLETPVPDAELPEPVAVDLPVPDEAAERPDEPRPHRRYWLVAAAAALVILLAVGGIVGYQAMSGGSGGTLEGVVWSASNPDNGVRADARMIDRPWGTEIQVKMAGVPKGASCRLVVYAKGSNGYKETAGWWGYEDEPAGEIPGSTSIKFSMIYKLEVVDEDNVLLVDLHRPK